MAPPNGIQSRRRYLALDGMRGVCALAVFLFHLVPLRTRHFVSHGYLAVDAFFVISGFVIAVALVKPGRTLAEVDVASVKRKMKDKAFAKGVRRDDILRGAAELGVPLDDHITMVIEALRQIAPQLGLDGARGRA